MHFSITTAVPPNDTSFCISSSSHTHNLHLFKEGIMVPNTKNFYTNWDIGLNASPHLSFNFLDKMNHQPVHTIMAPHCSNYHFPVQCSSTSIFSQWRHHFSFFLSLTSSSAHTHTLPEIIKREYNISKNCDKYRWITFCVIWCLGGYWVRHIPMMWLPVYCFASRIVNNQGNCATMHEGGHNSSSLINCNRSVQTCEWGKLATCSYSFI